MSGRNSIRSGQNLSQIVISLNVGNIFIRAFARSKGIAADVSERRQHTPARRAVARGVVQPCHHATVLDVAGAYLLRYHGADARPNGESVNADMRGSPSADNGKEFSA